MEPAAMPLTRPRRHASRFVRPRLEALEQRQVLSGVLGHEVLEVHQGVPSAEYQTIQSAVNAAAPGDEVLVFSGVYREAVTVTTPGLTIEGAPNANVVLEGSGQAWNGISVEGAPGAPLDGFVLSNMTVRDFVYNGVMLVGVNNFALENITAVNNGEYGLYPVLSAHGSISGCLARGSNDTGIYVGQSSDVSVSNNFAFDNVNGIEVENSTNVRTTYNVVGGNTVGILVDLLPAFLVAVPGYTPVESSSNNLVAHNLVIANNRPNTAEGIGAAEPPGTGIAVIGGDNNVLRDNFVVGNAFAGIALLSGNNLLALLNLGPGTPGYSMGEAVDPTDTLIAYNYVEGNGFLSTVPQGFPMPADLVWTGTGLNNHWVNNTFGTSDPAMLP
jgi:parallel beta-helix repeat protein